MNKQDPGSMAGGDSLLQPRPHGLCLFFAHYPGGRGLKEDNERRQVGGVLIRPGARSHHQHASEERRRQTGRHPSPRPFLTPTSMQLTRSRTE